MGKTQQETNAGKEPVRYTKKPERNAWLKYAFGAMMCFTLCNEAISEVSGKVGPLCLFYFAPGTIVISIFYYAFAWYKQKGWVDQNIIVDGSFKLTNFIGFVIYALIYFII